MTETAGTPKQWSTLSRREKAGTVSIVVMGFCFPVFLGAMFGLPGAVLGAGCAAAVVLIAAAVNEGEDL